MNKRNKIIYWVATIWLSLGMVSTGLGELLGMKSGAGGADSILHLGYPTYFITWLGIWKILGVIAVLIPRFPLLKEWAYADFSSPCRARYFPISPRKTLLLNRFRLYFCCC